MLCLGKTNLLDWKIVAEYFYINHRNCVHKFLFMQNTVFIMATELDTGKHCEMGIISGLLSLSPFSTCRVMGWEKQ